jgi:bifunctional non-homologous end joining protein LigD
MTLDFPVTHLDKVLYPEQGLRKGELLAYYAAVAPWMLPHVAGRPLTLVRCPDGRHRHCFYQKHPKDSVPSAIERVAIDAGEPYMAVRGVEGLLAAAQLGALELHTWVCHLDDLERPDQLVVDLDPDAAVPFEEVVRAALEVRERLAAFSLESFVKTTGGKGLHVVAPVARRLSWDEHKAFAIALAEAMAQDAPERFTANARKAQRRGRIFVDALRNARGATAVAPYSPRAREGAPVATPVTWSELQHGLDPRSFTVARVGERLAALRSDPWEGYAACARQSVTRKARRQLGLAT